LAKALFVVLKCNLLLKQEATQNFAFYFFTGTKTIFGFGAGPMPLPK
jgi:hypothetical protein